MARSTSNTYYELLELEKGATFEDIEASYQRMLGFVASDSLAVYSLFGEEEALALRSQLEEAYRTLSDPDRRAAYDRVLAVGGAYPAVLIPEQRSDSNVSMGHVRPDTRPLPEDEAMDVDAIFRDGGAAPDEMTALDAPSVPTRSEHESRTKADSLVQAPAAPPAAKSHPRGEATARPLRPAPAPVSRGPRRRLIPNPDIEINFDAEFSGVILRRLRESCQATVDEVAEITKISKRYLLAIEENDFNGLPASVYVRGFVSEYARVLGLDMQRVAQSYMTLYKRYRGEGG